MSDRTDWETLIRAHPGDDVDVGELLAQLLNRPAWHQRAACRGMGPELFFPPKGRTASEAVEVCEACPVRAECHQAAVEGDEHGVWAGTTRQARRAAPEAA